MMKDLEDLDIKEWIRKRANEVRSRFSAYDCLHENGHGEMLVDLDTPVQVSCPFHGPDNRPSGRYYPSSGYRSDYLRCYTCKENWDAINLYMKFRGLEFMEALKELEKRFHVQVPRSPKKIELPIPEDKKEDYTSEAWTDIPRVISIVESKLLRNRNNIALIDFIKICRLIDAIDYDFEKLKEPDAGTKANMVGALLKAKDRIDEIKIPDFLL